jgi:hypothetical protein
MQCVLQGADEDLAAIIVGDLALLDEGNGSDQGLYGARVLSCNISFTCLFIYLRSEL